MPETIVPSAIGGYFELELARFSPPHKTALALNSGRSCITKVLEYHGSVKHVHVPTYTCDVVLEPLKARGVSWSFYDLNDKLEPRSLPQVQLDELVIVNNYFGLKDEACGALATEFGEQLIVDCSQAWFAQPSTGAHVFYTPRKFFGVPDGGLLYGPAAANCALDRDQSVDRCSHLLKRIDQGPEEGYADFQRNDASLSGQPLRRMSRLTAQLLQAFDHEAARERRVANYRYLHSHLGTTNKLQLDNWASRGPMVYPYLGGQHGARKRLHAERIYVATYWPNVLAWTRPGSWEYQLASDLLPLPIDQRYSRADMDRILEALL